MLVRIEPRIWDAGGTCFAAHGDGLMEYLIALDLESVAPTAPIASVETPSVVLPCDQGDAPRTATPLLDPGAPPISDEAEPQDARGICGISDFAT